MKIAVKPNLTRENAYQVTLSVYNELKQLNADIFFSNEFQEQLSDLKTTFLDDETLYKTCDITVAIGGDGTIIRSAHKCAEYGKKILGINAGRLAFMAGLEKQELYLLKNLINEEYSTDERMMLRCDLYENDEIIETKYCLNDAVIARGLPIKMCDISVRCDGNHVNDYFADGIIISTPTGSTAYSLSAGGPVIEPTIESIAITPICTHSLFSRSLIFKPTSVIEICFNNHDGSNPSLCCDGFETVELNGKNKIIIQKAEFKAQFIRIKTDSFVDVLSEKLAQRRV